MKSSERWIQADMLFTGSGRLLKQGIVHFSPRGVVLGFYRADDKQAMVSERYRGLLMPGFVNAHAHLELSFAAGKLPPHGGMDAFIAGIQSLKKSTAVDDKMRAAALMLKRLWDSGVQAIGDICNTDLTWEIKTSSPMLFKNFIEVYGLQPEGAAATMAEARRLKALFKSASIVPHAPYSLSQPLMEAVAAEAGPDDILSMHHQESRAENDYFLQGVGTLAQRFRLWELPLPAFVPSEKGPAQTLYRFFKDTPARWLFVHNTFSSPADIAFVRRHYKQPYFCLCPQSNLFIGDSLPAQEAVEAMLDHLCLGTDSPASNPLMSIPAELALLQNHYPHIAVEHWLRAASLNGARALALDDRLGSFTPGKVPGAVLITPFNPITRRITEDSVAQRVV